MIFNERDRSARLYIEAERLKALTPQQTLDMFFDMNRAVLRMYIESIKADNPEISEKDLLKEVKRIYALRKRDR